MITSTIFQDLTQRFERLINICKGWEIPLKKFYETKTGQKDIPVLAQALTDRLSSELAGYKQFYYHFFLMTLAYLESACNLEDIATVLLST